MLKSESITNVDESSTENNDQIVDTRFQSFARFYIHDILNSELIHVGNHLDQNLNKRGIIKIDETYLCKVSICGTIVSIFDTENLYRLKVDDSTGVINVTLWKNSVFNENSTNLCSEKLLTTEQKRVLEQFKPTEVYSVLDSLRMHLKEKSVNNAIMYEPKQGDLVVIRANIKHFKERIELSAVSCVRVQNSSEELSHIILPSILGTKCYSVEPTKIIDQFTDISNPNQSVQDINKSSNENLLNLVYKKLLQLCKSQSGLNETGVEDKKSCNYYLLYNLIKTNAKVEYGFITHLQVLNALKELELRGLVYSCEDEFNYLPIESF